MTWIYFTFGEFGEKGSPTFGMGPISLLPVKQVGVSAKKNACTTRSGSPLNKSPLLLLSPYTLSRHIVVPVFDSTRRIQYFQTGDDRSVGSCVTMHREATLSKQLWQANGASRTRCFSCSQFFLGLFFFFQSWKQQQSAQRRLHMSKQRVLSETRRRTN